MCKTISPTMKSLVVEHSLKPAKIKTRKQLYQLDGYYCPVIGTCMTLGEIKKVLRQSKYNIKGLTDHDLHILAVSKAQDKRSVTGKRLQKVMDKKYQHLINKAKKFKEIQQLQDFWSESFYQGDIAGAFWVIITHPLCDVNLLKMVYGEVHMLSHISGASQRYDIKTLDKLKNLVKEKECAANDALLDVQKWKNKYQRMQQKLVEYAQELRQNKEKIEQLENKLNQSNAQQLQIQREHVQQLEKKQQQSEVYIHKLTQQVEKKQEKNQQLQVYCAELLGQVKNIQKENQLLQQLSSMHPITDCQDCPLDTPQQNLCGKCVLYVGGRTNLKSHYKQVVEQYNGTFLHHDGGIEDNQHHLPNLLSSADIIVCPHDCISHNAYWKVKKYSKQLQKTCIITDNAGLSSLQEALTDIKWGMVSLQKLSYRQHT